MGFLYGFLSILHRILAEYADHICHVCSEPIAIVFAIKDKRRFHILNLEYIFLPNNVLLPNILSTRATTAPLREIDTRIYVIPTKRRLCSARHPNHPSYSLDNVRTCHQDRMAPLPATLPTSKPMTHLQLRNAPIGELEFMFPNTGTPPAPNRPLRVLMQSCCQGHNPCTLHRHRESGVACGIITCLRIVCNSQP